MPLPVPVSPLGSDTLPLPPDTAAPLPTWTPAVGLTDLARVLAVARRAHTEYLEAIPRTLDGRLVQDTGAATEALDRACAARETADVLDPDHSDPAWVQDRQAGYDQFALLAFYRGVRKRRGL